MSDEQPAEGLKSAYDLALERLEQRGISRPDEGAVADATRLEMAEIRQQAKAKLAELEILHRDAAAPAGEDGAGPTEAEEEYLRERRRIEDNRDRKLARLRGEG